jgi:hypothetical protein
VGAVSVGAWLVYAAIRDVDPVYGLRDILAGNAPASRSEGGSKALARAQGIGIGKGLGTGDIGAGVPIPESQTTVVKGIRVATVIAPQVDAMLSAASKAGFSGIGGGGWRSSGSQRALRLLHGYTSDDQPSGHGGKLPVARPGTSRHEQGRAIDFTVNGKSLESRNHPFFRWLAQNAGMYGFKNLPSEPWHWSTDGH